MKKEEIKLCSSCKYDGKIVRLFVDKVMCPNGNEAYREIVHHRGGVCALSFDLDGKIILVNQFRYAFNEELLELPAGKIEEGESPLETITREYEEETGNFPDEIISLGEMYPTCGYSNEIIYLYYVKKHHKTKTKYDVDEFIDIKKYDLNEVIEMINKNIIKDAKTVCAVFKYINMAK